MSDDCRECPACGNLVDPDGLSEMDTRWGTCSVMYPPWQGHTSEHKGEIVTPRFDLPRAWTPDGEPVPMKGDMK